MFFIKTFCIYMQFFLKLSILIIKITLVIIFLLIFLDGSVISLDYKYIVITTENLVLFLLSTLLYFIYSFLPEKWKSVFFIMISSVFIFIFIYCYNYSVPMNNLIFYILNFFLKYKIINIFDESSTCLLCTGCQLGVVLLLDFFKKLFGIEF